MKYFNGALFQLLPLYFAIVFIFCISFGCKGPNEPPYNNTITTTIGMGKGGPAYIAGNIRDYMYHSKVVANTDIYIMDQQNYSDTLAHIFVTSTDASFKITDLPEVNVDLIFMNENYLCAKIGKLKLNASGNNLYNPNSSGYFIDSTIYLTSVADSVGKNNTLKSGLQGYVANLTVYFKSETYDSTAWEIVKLSGCDTLNVYRYNNPAFDPFENDVYYLSCPSINSVSKKLIYFNWLKEVKRAGQIFQIVQE